MALTVFACSSLAPRYEAPPLPVAEMWPKDAPTATQSPTTNVASIGWADYFTDPVLLELIESALENNRNLRVAVLRVEEARAGYRIERSALFPDIRIDVDATRARTPGALSPNGMPGIGSEYRSGLGVGTWEIDFWGRVRSLRDAALENFLATDYAQSAVRLSLITQVANDYLSLRELDERVALAKQTIANRQDSFRIFSRRYEVGAVSRLDLTQVEVLLTQAQALGAQLQQARAYQTHALTQLVGAPLDIPAENRYFGDATKLAHIDVGLPSELLVDRPDIISAEHRLRASNADIGAARAAFFPRIALTGFVGNASAEIDSLFNSDVYAWTFAPRLSLPIFNAGRNQANLDLVEVRQHIAVAEYESTIQAAFREVADALSARVWLAEQVNIQEATLVAQSERARLATLRYDNGAAPYLEVLDAQRDLLSAGQQLVQTQRAARANEVVLYAALGGGTATNKNSQAALSDAATTN